MYNYSKESLSVQARTNIRKYRLIRGYTLQELADLSELTHGYIRDLECLSIEKQPTLDALGKIANALNIDIRQLFDDIPSDN